MKPRCVLVGLIAAAAVLGLAAPAPASFPATEVFIPSTGRGPGLAGSQWYTTVWVYNPGASPVPVAYTFLVRDQPNPASPHVLLDVIQPGETRRYTNAVQTMFGIEGFGAIRAVADLPLMVNSRIYSLPATGSERDSVGQFFAAVPAAFAIGAGETTQILGVFDTSIDGDSEFRTNIGFVETAGSGATVRTTVFDDLGVEMTHRDDVLGPFEVRQYGLTTMFPGVGTVNARVAVTVLSGPGRVIAFGSSLANRSNDPSTFEMRFDESMLAESTAVVHDGSLTGDGSATSPLGLADGGVVKSKINAAGGAAGQVLGTDGSALRWQEAEGLTFPYARTVNTGMADAFAVTNVSGTGPGVTGRGEIIGVKGSATVTAGTMYAQGLWGTLAGDLGYGVRGSTVSSASTAWGVWGEHGSGNYGALGTSYYGVRGQHRDSTNFAGLGAAGQAVFAHATTGIGVQAESEGNGLSAAAVLAKANGDGGIAVHATAQSTDSALVVTNQGTGDLVRAFSAAGDLRFRVTNAGNVSADGTFSPGGADFAELVPAGEDGLEAGEVLVVRSDGSFGRSSLPYQPAVMGVVSTLPGIEGDFWRALPPEGKVTLALIGIVPVKVNDEGGAIEPGDTLTTSSIPGVAMRASRHEPGAVVGTALAVHRSGTGVVPVLLRAR